MRVKGRTVSDTHICRAEAVKYGIEMSLNGKLNVDIREPFCVTPAITFEPVTEKTNNLGFRPGLTQTVCTISGAG